MIPQGNRVQEAIAKEQTAYGAAVQTGSPILVEILGDMGLEFVWIDLEHAFASPTDATELESLTRAANTGGTELLVRIPSPSPSSVRKVLDTGVRNIMIPRIENAETVQRVVEAARFEIQDEIGDRGLAPVRANGYGRRMETYPTTEDDSILVGAMIENVAAVRNLDEILSVPELGFVFIGPGDLSVSAGQAGNPTHDAVQEMITTIQSKCRSYDVPYAGVLLDQSRLDSMVEEGYSIIALGSDLGFVQEQVAQLIPAE